LEGKGAVDDEVDVGVGVGNSRDGAASCDCDALVSVDCVGCAVSCPFGFSVRTCMIFEACSVLSSGRDEEEESEDNEMDVSDGGGANDVGTVIVALFALFIVAFAASVAPALRVDWFGVIAYAAAMTSGGGIYPARKS